jgi:hypothetical protein
MGQEDGGMKILPFLALGPLLAALAGLPSKSGAQTRLDQSEATYQSNLKLLHAPILQDYLRKLELLKSDYTVRNRTDDAAKADAEIQRVKSILGTTGVLPYTEHERASQSAADPATAPQTPPTAPKPPAKPLPTLAAANAVDAAERIDTGTEALPLGRVEWTSLSIPKGTYDVLIVFSSEALPLPEQLILTIGAQEFKCVVPSDRATASPKDFRLMRLTQAEMDSDAIDVSVRLAGVSQDKQRLWIKRLIFTKPKPADGTEAR